MRIHQINVGQGAAELIEFSCGAVLVDTGGESNESFESESHLMNYLDEFFKSRPDLHETLALLLITHNHVDHDRSATTVERRYKVLNIVTNGLTTSSGGREQQGLLDDALAARIPTESIQVATLPKLGLRDAVVDPLSCADGDPDIRVLWGAVTPNDVSWEEPVFKNANNDSVVVKFTLGKASVLITGDLELDGIDALLKRYAGTGELKSDVYVVGHHGSWNATTEPLLAEISPRVALIGVGSSARHGNWTAYHHGHPRLSTIELLEKGLSGSPRDAVQVPVAVDKEQFMNHQLTAPIYATGWDSDEDIIATTRADGQVSVTTHAHP